MVACESIRFFSALVLPAEKNFSEGEKQQLEIRLRLTGYIKLHFTFISFSTPMTSVDEKMKHDFLHQEIYFFLHNWSGLFFWHERSHFTFKLCSMLMSPKLPLFAIFNRLLVGELNQSVVVSSLQNYCFYDGHYRHYGLKLTLLYKATVSMENANSKRKKVCTNLC